MNLDLYEPLILYKVEGLIMLDWYLVDPNKIDPRELDYDLFKWFLKEDKINEVTVTSASLALKWTYRKVLKGQMKEAKRLCGSS